LGLDIGSHSIKLVEVKHTRGGPIITLAKSVPIAREQEEDTDYVGDIAIGEALRELLGKSKLRSKRVITAVSSALEAQVTILPNFFIPNLVQNLPKATIKENVMAEAVNQAHIPFPADLAVADCDVLKENTVGGRKGLEVFFFAIHRDLIDSQFRLLNSVGLIPIAIDVDFLALARLLGVTNQIPDDEDIAIIDIGASKTSVGFYQHGRLHIYPHVPIAGDYLTDEVSQQFSINWEEAEEGKKKSGAWRAEFSNSVTSGPEEQLSAGTSEVIQRALEEVLYPQLQSQFDFYEAEFLDFKPSKIFSAGGTSQLPNLDKFLVDRLSIPVENVSYLDSIPMDAKGDVSEIKGNEPLFATAVGLALKKKL